MKKIIFLLCLLLAFSQTNAQIWTVNACSAELGLNTYGPMSSVATANATSRTAVIYPASQLGTLSGLQLTNMYFKRITAAGTMAGTPNFKIYLKEVSNTDWGATSLDWATATTGATLVYDSNPATNVGSTAGWKAFPLTGLFTYSGTQNLAVFTEYQNTTASTAITWSYEYTAPCISTTNSNTTKYANNTTATYPATLASTNYRRPLIGFDFPVSCPAPSVLTATGITTNSVNLGWVSNGTETEWAYVVQPQGSGYPTGTGTVVTANPYTVLGLNSSTNYEVYVRANCGVGDSSFWTGPILFATTCAPLATPVLENFATFLPSVCWFNRTGGDLTTGPTTLTGSGWVADGFANVGTTGAVRNEIWTTGANDWFISPEITIPASGYELKFDAAAPQWNNTTVPTTPWESDDFIEVLVSTTGLTNWTPVFTYNDTNQPLNTGTPNIIDLDAYAGQNIRIAFRAVEGATNGTADIDFSIDNFQVRLTPTCIEPLNLVSSGVTSSTVNISWDATAPSPATGYEYFVSTTNTVPVTAGTATTNTFAIPTGLLPQTTYYVFVRSDCSAGDFSSWTGPISFTTACAPVAVPVLEQFNTFLPSICWTEADNGDLTAGPLTYGTGSWLVDGFGNVGTTGAARVTLDAAADNDWIITPEFTIPATGFELKFDAAATQGGAVNAPTTPWESDDFVEVLATTTGTTNWTVLFTYNDINSPSNTGSVNIIDLDAYNGQNVRFAFRAVEGATNGAASVDFSIDNFQIRLTPTCIEPLNIVTSGVTSSGVNISWDPTSPSPTTGYEYFVSTTSTVPLTAGTGTTNTFAILSGLLPQTTYYIFVRSDCGAGDFSSWTGPISFTTACAPLTTLPWIENFDALATGTNLFPTCWNYSNTLNTWAISTAPVAYSGANSLRRTWSTDGWAFTPMFTLAAGTSYTFSYYVRTNDTTVGYDVTVGVGNTQNSAGMTTTLSSVVGYQGPTWTLVTLEYTPTVSGDYSFGVRVVAPVDPNGINFDNFELKLTPACPAPIASASAVTDVTANLSWAAVASATLGYEYVLDNVATDPAGAGTSTLALAYPASGLTPLTVYYFHIRSVCSVGTYSTWSTVSFTTSATPPVNDTCGTAIALTVGATFSSNITDGNNTGATSGSEGAPTTCFGYSGGDIWYSALVPTSGTLTIETGNSTLGATGLDTVFAIYTGTCGALTQINCDDDGAATGSYSLKALTGLTPGSTLLIRVYEYGNDNTGGFGISAYDASLSAASFDKSTFVAYPNPVKDVLNLSYKTAISNVKVVNLLGQEVLNVKSNANDVQVNMSALNAGAYMVNITVEDTVHTIKVIKE